MPLILGTNSIKDTTFEVANSLRFNSASSDSLTRSTSGAGTSNTTFTISLWIKKTTNASAVPRLLEFYNNSSYYISLRFRDDINNRLDFYSESNGSAVNLRTNRSFRDLSAWMHIVMRVDTTQSTADDRLRMYINGVQETSFSARTNPSSSENFQINGSGVTHLISQSGSDTADNRRFNGYMAEVCFIDGQSLDPTSFGEFDSDTNIWKPIDVKGLTFGNNGFYLDFEDSSALGNDVSGNNNDFTVNNLTALDQSIDTCTNNFATMSTPTWYDGTITNGGLTVSTDQSNYRYQTASIGFSKGKWYWEIKFVSYGNYSLMGITDEPAPSNTASGYILGAGANAYSVVYNNAGGNGHKYNNAGTSPTNTPGAYMNGFSAGDIIMFALDCDNNTLKIGANDSWANGSGNTNQTFSNTTPISITAPASTSTGFYFPAVGDYGGSTSVFDFNFGSPPYSITSGNADGNGYGNFEYSVPSDYYSINTKNLAEFG